MKRFLCIQLFLLCSLGFGQSGQNEHTWVPGTGLSFFAAPSNDTIVMCHSGRWKGCTLQGHHTLDDLMYWTAQLLDDAQRETATAQRDMPLRAYTPRLIRASWHPRPQQPGPATHVADAKPETFLPTLDAAELTSMLVPQHQLDDVEKQMQALDAQFQQLQKQATQRYKELSDQQTKLKAEVDAAKSKIFKARKVDPAKYDLDVVKGFEAKPTEAKVAPVPAPK